MEIKLDYLWATTVKGRRYVYYRRNGQNVPIDDGEGKRLAPGDAGFIAAYDRIHASFEAPETKEKIKAGSLRHVITRYRGSQEFRQLAPKTRKDYGRYLDLLSTDYGHLPVATMPRAFVFELRDKFEDTPRTANYIVAVLRLVMTYAVDRGYRDENPVSRPKRLRTGDGHRPWEEFEIHAFRDHWAPDTLQRVAFELLLNTGQRGGDVAAMRRQQRLRGGWIKVRQEKTNALVEIPESRDLADVLGPWLETHEHVMILTNPSGGPVLKDYLRHMMRDAYRAVGLHDVTTHGLRYTAARILRELECDWETIQDVTGHKTAEQARQYAEKRRRTRIAITRLDEARNKSRPESEKPTDEK